MANNLNQYSSRTVPGFVNVIGTASNLATVTLWGDNGAFSPTSRKGDYFRGELAVTNTANPVWLTITNLAVLNDGSNPDIVTNAIGKTFVPQIPELFYYDADGNLTNDGRWIYTWDAENRLVQQESLTGAPTGSKFKLEFAYDAKGRRLQKLVSTNNGSSYVAQYTNRFAYDRWNLIGILASDFSLQTSFQWGLDLSGSQQGAGGVGGLLPVRNVELSVTNFVAHDGNGNVAVLVNVANGGVTGQYEYGPFGELLRATGASAKANPFRFSTKYQDDESDFLYYGYRSYNPDTGRWLSRDPINEFGFKLTTHIHSAFNFEEEKNLYAFVGNNSVNHFDPDGQKKKGRIAILIGFLTGCGKGPKAPRLPTLDANCAADPEVKKDYQRLIDCNSIDSDGNAECSIVCDCLAQGGGPAMNVCYDSCRKAYAKRCF